MPALNRNRQQVFGFTSLPKDRKASLEVEAIDEYSPSLRERVYEIACRGVHVQAPPTFARLKVSASRAFDLFSEVSKNRVVDETRFSSVAAATGHAVSIRLILHVLDARLGSSSPVRLRFSGWDRPHARLIVRHPEWHARPLLTRAPTKEERLAEILRTSPDRAPDFINAELQNIDISADWRSELVFAAERLEVVDATRRRVLSDRLFKVADDLRQRALDRDQATIWAAVRRSSSLGDHERLSRLIVFLDAGNPAELRQVALQAIVNKAQRAPIPLSETLVPLRKRVAEIADELVRPELLSIPVTAALAMSAVMALAAIDPSNLKPFVERFTAKPVLAAQLRRELSTLPRLWNPNVDDYVAKALAEVRAAEATLTS